MSNPAPPPIEAHAKNITDKLSPHLTVAEFTDSDSDSAARLGIDKSLPCELVDTARETGTMLEEVRSALDNSILVIAVCRCPDLNKAIGVMPTSDHPKALALERR